MSFDQTLQHNLVPISVALILLIVTAVFFLKPQDKPAIDPVVFKEFKLVKKVEISGNTALYRFALPNPNLPLNLPIGQHISVSAVIDGKVVMRSYTPTSGQDDKGFFELLIKSYPTGNISKHFLTLVPGKSTLSVRGPKGQFKYDPSLAKKIGMIAGGTGITPMLQIIRASLKNPLDFTKLSLVYANVNYEDILLKSELDSLAASSKGRFTVYYVLNNAPEKWDGGIGFVTTDIIKKVIGERTGGADEEKVLLCGPPPMMTAMKKCLAELNYEAPRTVSKLADQVFLF